MAEGPIGEFYHRYPDNFQRHSNEGNQPNSLTLIPCHAHTFGHVRFLWANDTPGPDGRKGWWERAWSPVFADDLKTVICWREERNHLVRGDGPDSARWIPAGWRHEFTLLSMSGYHMCFYHNREADGSDAITPAQTGYGHN